MCEKLEVLAAYAILGVVVVVDRLTGLVSRSWEFPEDDVGAAYDDEPWPSTPLTMQRTNPRA